LQGLEKFKFTQSISFRIPVIILIVFLLGISVVASFCLKSQNNTINLLKENELRQEAEIVSASIKNNMLAGEAPIAVKLFRDNERPNLTSKIILFRTDGTIAFSDNTTVEAVNKRLGKSKFSPKSSLTKKGKDGDSGFSKSAKKISDTITKEEFHGSVHSLVIYKPLMNEPKCTICHGTDQKIRGVIKISSPIGEVYKTAKHNSVILVMIFAVIALIAIGTLFYLLKNNVINRILDIRDIVKSVRQGDFETKIMISRKDEIGSLGNEVNKMIDGLKERQKLSTPVYESPFKKDKKDEKIKLGGEKKRLTVLFTDIRDFTKYSENKDPGIVLVMLNKIMNLQAEIITAHGGDIDKFVGDEIMAVFEGEDMALRALSAAERIKQEIKAINRNEEMPVYIGMGINTGVMISGNMGSCEKADRTVIGDAVNLGERLCSLAGNNTIVLSEFSYGDVSERIAVNEHGAIAVKGKSEKVRIYTLKNIL